MQTRGRMKLGAVTLGTSCLEFIGLIASGGLRLASRIGNGLTQLARDLRVLAADSSPPSSRRARTNAAWPIG